MYTRFVLHTEIWFTCHFAIHALELIVYCVFLYFIIRL
jgi:hypothetical protein